MLGNLPRSFALHLSLPPQAPLQRQHSTWIFTELRNASCNCSGISVPHTHIREFMKPDVTPSKFHCHVIHERLLGYINNSQIFGGMQHATPPSRGWQQRAAGCLKTPQCFSAAPVTSITRFSRVVRLEWDTQFQPLLEHEECYFYWGMMYFKLVRWTFLTCSNPIVAAVLAKLLGVGGSFETTQYSYEIQHLRMRW